MKPRLNPSIFREYDVRGIVGEDLTMQTVRTIGLSYGTYLRRGGIDRAVLGRDCRLSSAAYHSAICDALLETGVSVVDIGMVPTPVLYFAGLHLGVDGGVMVTGSHNPPQWNGFKLAYGAGTLYGEQIRELLRIAQSGDFVWGSGKASSLDILPHYVDDTLSRISLGSRPVKVVVDAGNGAAGPVTEMVLDRLGADYVPMNFRPDGTFPNHHPDPTLLETIAAVAHRVRETDADLGIAFDGDADRVGVVAKNGQPVWGDLLQAIFWGEILPKHPGSLALVEVKCSQALVDAVNALGGRTEFTRAGHSLIKARMRETNALFAGEMSGHMFFRDEHPGYDDGLYAACRLLRILTNTDRDVEGLLEGIPRYHSTPEIRVHCPDQDKFAVVDAVARTYEATNEVITVDGARVLFPHGWGLVRASNTQPALVLRCESKTPEGLGELKSSLETVLGGYPSVGTIQWE